MHTGRDPSCVCVRRRRPWSLLTTQPMSGYSGTIIVCGSAIEVDRLCVIAATILAQIAKRVCSGYQGVVGIRQTISAASNVRQPGGDHSSATTTDAENSEDNR